MYRSDVVRSRPAFYDESNLHGDSEVCLDILRSHDFGFVHQILTFRREHAGSLMSFSMRMNTYLAMVLGELLKYGPEHLSRAELATRRRECLTAYYQYLGKESLKFREREFWRYHGQKLSQLGHPLSWLRVCASAIGVVLDFVCNPKSTVQKAFEIRRRNRGASSRSPALIPVATIPVPERSRPQ
jgi:hypothetical protein